MLPLVIVCQNIVEAGYRICEDVRAHQLGLVSRIVRRSRLGAQAGSDYSGSANFVQCVYTRPTTSGLG